MRNLSVSPLSARIVAGVILGALASAVLLTAEPASAQTPPAETFTKSRRDQRRRFITLTPF